MIYRVLAALREDDNQGWIWVSGLDLKRRSLARVENTATGKVAYCEVRPMDRAYRDYHRESFRHAPAEGYLPAALPAAAISHWYRWKLGIPSTEADHSLIISEERNLVGFVRAVLDHPQALVKFCYAVGLMAVALGIALWFRLHDESRPAQKPAINKSSGLFRP